MRLVAGIRFPPRAHPCCAARRRPCPDYVDYWIEQLTPNENALAAFHVYTAVFCLVLISEAGQKFNRLAPAPVDGERLRKLWIALNDSLDKAAQGPATAA